MTAIQVVKSKPILGSITPRLFTPPLIKGKPGLCGCGCALSPDTSYGFEVDWFATNILERPLYPWQRWLVIHAGELIDGVPRFRRVLVVVGRQNGKTQTLIVLALYWMFMDRFPQLLGTSTQTKYAKKPWMTAYKWAMESPELGQYMAPRRSDRIRTAAGEEEWWTVDDSHYNVTAANAEGGRSLTVNRVIADELAKQYNHAAYGAAYHSMDEVENAQYWGLTTPDPKGVVYLEQRAEGLEYIQDGEDSPDLGMFEWSPPDGSDPEDPYAIAMANPNVGRTKRTVGRALNEARAAVKAGSQALIVWKTEGMCMLVKAMNPAVDPAAWLRCSDPAKIPDADRSNVALVFDVAKSQKHATLYAAVVLADGRTRVSVVKTWSGDGCGDTAALALPGVIGQMRIKPKVFGTVPGGPAASAVANIKLPGIRIQHLKSDLPQVCMGFAEAVVAKKVAHSNDPLLDAQVAEAEKYEQGAVWTFSRKNGGDCDALYAAAGARHLALTVRDRGNLTVVRSRT